MANLRTKLVVAATVGFILVNWFSLPDKNLVTKGYTLNTTPPFTPEIEEDQIIHNPRPTDKEKTSVKQTTEKHFANPYPVVTGSSSNHFHTMLSLLNSLTQHHPETQIIVYNLGLSEEEIETLHPWLDNRGHIFRTFDYSKYPPHFDLNVNAGQWAWKPVIIKEVVDEFGKALWLDAGDKVLKPLTKVFAILREDGFVSFPSDGSISSWTHPGMIEYLKPNQHILWNSNCNGAINGWDKSFPKAYELLTRWVECAMDKACIAPEGSSRDNHRQDQAALSVLAHMYDLGASCDGFGRWDNRSPWEYIGFHRDDEEKNAKLID